MVQTSKYELQVRFLRPPKKTFRAKEERSFFTKKEREREKN